MAAKEKKELLTVDDAWLEKYVNFSNPAVKVTDVASGEQVDQADLSDVVEKQEDAAHKDADLNEALRRGKKQAQAEKKLHERAKKMDAASEERLAKERQDALEQQRVQTESKEEREKAKTVRDVRHVTQGVNKALENVNPLLERVGTLPTLGGVGLMVAILLILLVVIIPVNEAGDTRAKQFWYMLNGRAKLQGAVSPVEGSQVKGASGDFGPGSQNTPNTIITDTTSAQNGSFRTTPTNLGF